MGRGDIAEEQPPRAGALRPLPADRGGRRRRRAALHRAQLTTVLFVCVHNAGRSQMAAALLEREAKGRVRVLSAGSDPADEVNPAAVEALREVGLDLKAVPRRLDDVDVRAADVVVTMGCGDACPVYLGKRYEDWELPDPAGKTLEEVRAIRDDIARRVGDLLERLEPA